MLNGLSLFAQQVPRVAEDKVTFQASTRRYVEKETNAFYTGYTYKLFSRTNDTAQLTYYSNGVRDWDSAFAQSGQVLRAGNWYNHGLKGDSITSEYLIYNERGDTLNYYVQQVKDGVKLQTHYWYVNFSGEGKRPFLYQVSRYRFFHKKETGTFIDPSFKEKQRYDSCGFHESMAAWGMDTLFYDNGRIRSTGRQATYEYCLTHQGRFPSSPHSGRVGVWKTYHHITGALHAEVEYDRNGMEVETREFHPNGVLKRKSYYRKRFSEIRIPSRTGLKIAPNDLCLIKEAKWYDNGQLELEDFETSNGTWITCAYHRNGNPATFRARTKDYEPIGIHKDWDENGHVTEFINYTDERNDTICFKALNGKLTVLNLRKRTLPREPLRPPGIYRHSIDAAHNRLVELTDVYRTFFANGQVQQEIHLVNAEREGTSRGWDSAGTLILEVQYHLNAPHGAWKEWYSSGKIKKTFTYTNGWRDGTCTEYYETGTVKWKNTYSNGTPGTPVAFDTLGNRLANGDYLSAFGDAKCIQHVVNAFGESALHYYFEDTSVQRTVIVTPDVQEKYALRLALGFIAAVPALEVCSDWKNENDAPATDLHHSCLAVSSSLYTDSHQVIIDRFFTRHGIVADSVVAVAQPVLGIQQEYFMYCSSTGLMDKMFIVDSLQFLLTQSSSIDVSRGYILSVDAGHPARPGFYQTHCASMRSGPGYTELEMRSKIKARTWYSSYRRVDVIVYRDLSFDVRQPAIKWEYWPPYP